MDTLKFLESINDNFGFLTDLNNYSNHRPVLLLALSLTRGKVTELGAGEGSTKHLREYCKANDRQFSSFESDMDWSLKCGAAWVASGWDDPARDEDVWQPCSLLFIDHAPGEHRHVAVERMANKADIIVIHDTEEGGAGDYKFERIWHLFKYRLNLNKTGGGAGATAVSNSIDLNRYRGLSLGHYTFDDD